MQSRLLVTQYDQLKQRLISRYFKPFFNPFIRVRCPFCLEEFYPGHAEVVHKSPQATHPPPSPPATRGWRGFLARCWVRRLDGPDNTRVDARRQCPNPACKKLWPPLIERAENHIIAVLGARGSGKSCYIAVTIEALKQQATAIESLGMANVRPLSDEVDRLYRDTYYRYLERRQQLPETLQPAGANTQPLMYEITFQKPSEGRPGMPVNIILYDVSGETLLKNPGRAVQELPFLFHASAVIYFADPLAIDSIWEQWKGAEGVGSRPEAGIAEVLMNMAPPLARARGTPTFTGPVAIALSKSDLVEGILPQSGEDYLFAERPTYEEPKGKIRQQEFAAINGEVMRLLNELDQNTQRKNDLERLATSLLTASKSFPKKLFFAVSATGCRPTSSGIYEDFHPRRCLDPLFWILGELGIIEIE